TVVSAAAITMAQKSQLERRLLAVLDVARSRGVPTPRVVAGLFLIAGMACAVIAACQLTPAVATGPLEHVTLASGVTAQLQDRDFTVTYSTGHKARVVAVGNDGEGQYGDAWGPDGALL